MPGNMEAGRLGDMTACYVRTRQGFSHNQTEEGDNRAPCNYANVGGASAYPIAGSGPFHNTVPESDLMHVSGLGSDSVL